MTDPLLAPGEPSDATPPDPAPPPAPGARAVTIAELLSHITPRAWVTPTLVALMAVGFGVEVVLGASPITPTGQQLLSAGGNFGPSVADGEWWRLATSLFLHAGLMHIAFNVWAFWSMGRFAERVFGNVAFLTLYLLSGAFGGLASLTTHPLTVCVGASGAIFGVYGAMLAFVVLHKGVIPAEFLAKQRNSLLVFLAYNVVFGLSQPNIDLSAHGGGLVSGFFLGALLSRDLRAPKAHVAKRVLSALAMTAAFVVLALSVNKRLVIVPEIRADRAASSGYTHLIAGDMDGAIRLYSDAIAFENNDGWVSNRGLAYLEKGDFEAALKDFRVADGLKSTPRTAGLVCEAAYRRASTAEEQASVVEACSRAIKLDPTRADLLCYRAAAYSDQKKVDLAMADADAAITLNPSSQLARRTRVFLRVHDNKAGEAEDDCVKLVAFPEPTATDVRMCAQAASARHDTALERKRLDRALELDPADLMSHALRAALNLTEGHAADSLADYRAVVKVAPDDPAGWNNLAWALLSTSDFAQALPAAERSVALAPTPSHLAKRCYALVGLGRRAEGRADCAKALEATPDDGVAGGMLAYLDGQTAAAIEIWSRVSDDPFTARGIAPWLAKVKGR